MTRAPLVVVAVVTVAAVVAFAALPARADDIARGAFALPTVPAPRADAPLPPPIVLAQPVAPTVPAPSLRAPIPPPIIAPPPIAPPGHWKLTQPHRAHFATGIAVAAGVWLVGAVAGLATRDYWLCMPIAGPVLGTVGPDAPRGAGVVAIYGSFLLAAGVGLQALFGPAFVALGLQREWKWIPDP